MSLAVLAPFRADTERRAAIQATTKRLWADQGIDVIYADDGLNGPLFSYARAANRARRMAGAVDVLVVYNVDALPLSVAELAEVEAILNGVAWSVLFRGQRQFTEEQTRRIIAGVDPAGVGLPAGPQAEGREALLAVRADVWDDLRGMDERFVGWGPEDKAWHHVLRTIHPDGWDIPRHGYFRSLAHPWAPRTANDSLMALWRTYPRDLSPAEMRAWYLAR